MDFVQGDAWALGELYSEAAAFDMFWLDFGVGADVAAFVRRIWPAIADGGYLVVHSTLTNTNTRTWLDAVRARAPEHVTGLDPNAVDHVSLLEPHKRFQNALTVLQKRPPAYAEPLYSVSA